MTNVTSDVKSYLQEKGVATILERFVANVMDDKPDDVLLYLEAWASNERLNSTAKPQEEEEAPEDPDVVTRRTWANVIQKNASTEAVAKKFLEILLLQHGILKRTLFEDVDTNNVVKVVVALLDQCFTGEGISDDEALDKCAEYPVVFDLEDKHIQYFLTAMHLALSTFFKHEDSKDDGVWTNKTNFAWNLILTQRKAQLEAAIAKGRAILAEGDEGSDDEASPAKTAEPVTPPEEVVKDSWEKLPEARQQAIIQSAFAALYAQHPTVKNTIFADLDIAEVSPILYTFLAKLGANGCVTDEEMESSGFAAVVASKGLEKYHVSYFIQALLSALSAGVSGWQNVSTAWRIVITKTANAVEKKFFSA